MKKQRPIRFVELNDLIFTMLIFFSVVAVALAFVLGSANRKLDQLSSQLISVREVASAGKLNFRESEKTWETWYENYNRDYFDGKLPRARIVSVELNPNVAGQTNMNDPSHPLIQMNPLAILGDKNARAVLLHEMIHVKIESETRSLNSQIISPGGWIIVGGEDEHGARFQQELHRLIGLGAFDDLLS